MKFCIADILDGLLYGLTKHNERRVVHDALEWVIKRYKADPELQFEIAAFIERYAELKETCP